MRAWKTPVSVLAILFDSFVFGVYNSGVGNDEDIRGVHKIPSKGDGTGEGITVKNQRLYKELHALEMETWDLVRRYERILRRYS